jgi:hypothetical protein
MKSLKIIYTIMPDYGRAYGWVIRDGDESQGVGPNSAGFGGWGGDHPISDELSEAFDDWQSQFEQAAWFDENRQPFDWPCFHAQGIALARRLKAELGDVVRIIYQKPFEDPCREIDERREVLVDGSLIALPGRMQLYSSPRISELIKRIVSGGQTGVDRAAIDWAIAKNIPCGGWCPRGRLAEDGVISTRYPLSEIESGSYRQRTRKNVADSDGTLVLNLGTLDGGTLQTTRFAAQLKKPSLLIQLDGIDSVDDLRTQAIRWLRLNDIHVLNIAGPRESKRPGIYRAVTEFLSFLDCSVPAGTPPAEGDSP